MEQYIVSARKYRPTNFESLIGQDNIATTLKNSITRGQLAHAYLFCGPRGVGKTSTARIFAKTINCENLSEDMEPCGQCESCVSFAEGRSYNIYELDAASNNSVDDIRDLTDKVRIPPQIGRYSVYIIDEVHMLSQAAFNAFLKTLEEPPQHAIFILATTEKHKILPTILSRCQTYDFNRITIEGIVRNLTDIAAKENIEISEDAMHIIAQKADGAMRDALTLFDQMVAFCGTQITYQQVIQNLNVLDYDYYFELTDQFLQGDYSSALLTFDRILSKGFNSLHFISGLSSHFRDLLVCKNASSSILMELAPTVAEKYRDYAGKCPLPFLFEALNVTTACEAGYKASGNPRLSIELALLKLANIATKVLSAPAATVPASVPAPRPAASPAPADASPAPAPAAKAVPTETPASAPAMATDTPRRTTGLSIKDMMRQTEASIDSTPKSVVNVEQHESFDLDTLKNVWQALAREQKHPRFAITMANTDPVLLADGITVVFNVKNDLQKKWIEDNCLLALESYLQKNLHNTNVKLTIEAPEGPQKPAGPYMPSEKAKVMLAGNEELRKLRDDLDLDVK